VDDFSQIIFEPDWERMVKCFWLGCELGMEHASRQSWGRRSFVINVIRRGRMCNVATQLGCRSVRHARDDLLCGWFLCVCEGRQMSMNPNA